MYKLVFTLLTMSQAPGLPPVTTSATAALNFASPEVCQRQLAKLKARGDHTLSLRGTDVTLHLVGGSCVPDADRAPQAPPFDPLDMLR